MDSTSTIEKGTVWVAVERENAQTGDWLAVEEPLQIRVDGRPLAVTMRTPGHDIELAAGFLFTEGIVTGRDDLDSLAFCPDAENAVEAVLSSACGDRRRRIAKAARGFRAVAACGLCGKTRLEDIYQETPVIRVPPYSRALVGQLPAVMRAQQALFQRTGGIHAAALFDLEGNLQSLREDVGRHNAIDKLIGASLLNDSLPLDRQIMVTSGRAGFEIVQKALMASVPVLIAVGAASSAAARMAKTAGMELYSFAARGPGNRHL